MDNKGTEGCVQSLFCAWMVVGYIPSSKTHIYFSTRYSILLAMSLNGIIALNIIEGSDNLTSFAHFIDGLLDRMNPWPLPNFGIVMDNCCKYKCEDVLGMITEWYVLPQSC
jgi:hypothetical protein